MAGPRGPKKHVADDFHFKSDESIETGGEIPTEESAKFPAAETVTAPLIEETAQEPADVVTSAEIAESPLEEKIHELVEQARHREEMDLDGWERIETCEHRGLPVMVSELPAGGGITAIWKRTRVFQGKRWTETGKWIDHMTGVDLSFPVKYWRPRFV